MTIRMTRPAALAITSLAVLLVACGSDVPASTGTTAASSSTEPATTVAVPAAGLPNKPIVVDDMGYGSLQDMAAAADLVVYGTVTNETSLGRPHVEEDPTADEYLGLTVTVETVLKGEPTEVVLLGWDAYGIDEAGQQVATNVMNGIPVPHTGEHVLLFLRPLDAESIAFMTGFPTHGPVSLDGVAFVEDGTVTTTDVISGDVIGLEGKTIAQIETLVTSG
jgi:hypothetical protein